MINGYRLITSASKKEPNRTQAGMSTGGVAILIHENLEQHILHIHRISHRVLKITMHSKETQTPVTIITTYAPHKGKSKKEQKEHWQEVKTP